MLPDKGSMTKELGDMQRLMMTSDKSAAEALESLGADRVARATSGATLGDALAQEDHGPPRLLEPDLELVGGTLLEQKDLDLLKTPAKSGDKKSDADSDPVTEGDAEADDDEDSGSDSEDDDDDDSDSEDEDGEKKDRKKEKKPKAGERDPNMSKAEWKKKIKEEQAAKRVERADTRKAKRRQKAKNKK